MEITGNIRPLTDAESFTLPKDEHPEGNYAITVNRLGQASSIDFVFESENDAQKLEKKFWNPPEKWKLLATDFGTSVKVLKPRKNEGKFILRIIANWQTPKEFKEGTVQKLVNLGLVPEEVLTLLS